MTATRPSAGRLLRRLPLAAALLAAAAGVWFGAEYFQQGSGAPRLSAGTRLSRPAPLQPFRLTDQAGKPFTLERLRGHWTFLAIGYTSCPDVCPTTLATFRALSLAVNAPGARPGAQFLFVSVDPERDTPERLARYVHYFDPRFLAATGSDAALRGLTRQLGLPYARVEAKDSAMGYLMDHSAAIVLIDPRVRFTAIFTAPQDPTTMAADFAAINTTSD
jgi:protein SCO1